MADPRAVAEGTMNRLCEGAPGPTARNLFKFEVALIRLATRRGWNRFRSQGWKLT